MPKQKREYQEEEIEDKGADIENTKEETPPVIVTITVTSEEAKDYFEKTLWSEIVPVFRCVICSHCESGDSSFEDIIKHIKTKHQKK